MKQVKYQLHFLVKLENLPHMSGVLSSNRLKADKVLRVPRISDSWSLR